MVDVTDEMRSTLRSVFFLTSPTQELTSSLEAAYLAARALEPARAGGDAIEAARLIVAESRCGISPHGWCKSEDTGCFCRTTVNAVLAAADSARGRAYIEWRDDMENAPKDHPIWLGQRMASHVFSAGWSRYLKYWCGIPHGWAPDCWAKIVPPPARVVRTERDAKLDRGDDIESDDFERRIREVPATTQEGVESALLTDLERRSFAEVLSVLIKLTDKYGWPQATSTGLKYLRAEWEKRDG